MIEVEKKFKLTEENKRRLIEGAEFLEEKIQKDSYFDTADFSLAKKDCWFRNRNDKWELKTPLSNLPRKERSSDQYREIEDEGEIAKFLGIEISGTFEDTLKANGYKKYATFTTTRQKYKKDGFGIDIDSVDFGYEVAEVELMVDSQSEMAEATQRIIDFTKHLGLSFERASGKLSQYFYKFLPEACNELVDLGILEV